MRPLLVGATVLMALGCGSKDQARYARLAERANPTILKMRPLVSLVLASDGDLAAKNRACLDAVSLSRGLADAGFDDGYGAKSNRVGVDDIVRGLQIDVSIDCADARKSTPDDGCQAWCAKNLRLLGEALRRFADNARAENVAIEPLEK